MELNYLFDTNIFLYHLAQDLIVSPLFSKHFLSTHNVVISSIVRIELLSFPKITEQEELIIREMLKQFRCISITEDVEEVTIYFRRKYKLKIPDAIIAATAFVSSSILLTANKRDFSRVPEIKVQTP